MKRNIIDMFLDWKTSSKRKPLLLKGARQTGKTYCLEEFGKSHFEKYHYFDFMKSSEIHNIFKENLNPSRIIRDLSLLIDTDIDISKDLIIFDEIQECPKALTALKYFAQDHPSSYICASGSLLGINLNDSSFPVGKIKRYTLYPMDFLEFLSALKQDRLVNAINSSSFSEILSDSIHQKIWGFYKYFMITGGLPEVVKTFRDNINTPNLAFKKVRELQQELFDSYMDDISKHSGKIKSIKIQAVLKSIPTQLAKEDNSVNKFIFKDVLSNSSRYADLEAPIEWLIKAGLIIKVPICCTAKFPLQAYAEKKRFKLYLFDVGILGSMLNLSPKVIFNYDYGSYKGYFAENIVLVELTSKYMREFYSWVHNISEIEFLLELEEEIIPIEVKAGINTKAKSLGVYKSIHSPKKTMLFSGKAMDIKRQEFLPLYLASRINELI